MLMASVGQKFKKGRVGMAGLCSMVPGTSAERNQGLKASYLKAL